MNPIFLSPANQNKALLWLLGSSCIIAFVLLLTLPAEPRQGLRDLAGADSLIRQELALFNIPDEQVRVFEYPVTDQFTRKHYRVDLPPQVSKTHLHAELKQLLRNRRIGTIGYVDVPADEMTLHLIYRDKVIRSLELRTDHQLVRIPHPARIYIYFNQRPGAAQINRIRALNIPTGIVLRSASPRELSGWADQLPDEMRPAWVWYDDGRSTYRHTELTDPGLRQALDAVQRVMDNPRLLAFGDPDAEGHSDRFQELDIAIDDGSEMMIVGSVDRFEFDRSMLAYSRLARQAGRPQLLVRSTEQNLDWLEEWIPRIRRGGVVFVNAS
ncbi:hypothetical protein QA596_00630 [Balneolales bacterium ANBcel1]|nr:hypothetical protein [Balneolales bacterium ANBcel1]